MSKTPKSPYEKAGGVLYFPRMCDKIRLHADGQLREDLQPNLGKGVDHRCTEFLGIAYDDVKTRVLAGGTDEEILQWCFENGRKLNETDLLVWQHFVTKLGWNDTATPRLQRYKEESGLAHRADLITMAEFMDVDEGRKP